MTHQKVSRAQSAERYAAWVLVAPLTVLYVLFFATPIVFATIQSFLSESRSGLGLGEVHVSFAGIQNYLDVLQDPRILKGFGRVFLIGAVQVPIMMTLATVMALLFDSGMVRMRQFFQTSAFLPHAIPGVISALLWSALYLPEISPIVKGLRSLGVAVNFLDSNVVLYSIMNMTTWEWTGYNMIILFAALQSIPKEVLESARVDGANDMQIALRIKLPLITSGLVITIMFSIIGSLQQFAAPAVLKGVTTGIDSRFTPNLAVYNLATSEGQPGMAAALSLIIALLAFTLSLLVLQARARGER